MRNKKKLFPLIITAFSIFFSSTVIMAEEIPIQNMLDSTIVSFFQPAIAMITTNPWVQGFLIILITFTISSLLTWLVFKAIRKMTTRTTMQIDDKIAAMLRPPVYISLVLLGIGAGLSIMPLDERLHTLSTRTLRSIDICVWAVFFIRLSSLLLTRIAQLKDRYTFIQHRTLTLFDNIAKVIIFGAAIYGIFVIWNINMTAWLASAGIAGIAVGFAAKDTLSNLFSGVFIIADAPYKVGDYVVLDKAGRGKVTNIGLRSTRILTRDDIEVTVPNSIIGNSTIINQSGGPSEKMRVRLPVGVAYGSDVDKVVNILQDIAEKDPQVCASPLPKVRFRMFGASSLDFELLYWVENPELRGRVQHQINTKVYKAFEEHNIEIPYSKQDIFIKSLPEKERDKLMLTSEQNNEKSS